MRIALEFSCSAVTAISQEEKCQLFIIMWSGQPLMRTFIYHQCDISVNLSSLHVTRRVEADYSQVFCLLLLHYSSILHRERCGWLDSHSLVHLGLLMC